MKIILSLALVFTLKIVIGEDCSGTTSTSDVYDQTSVDEYGTHIDCDDHESCHRSTLNLTWSQPLSASIRCSGAYACHQANITSSGGIRCYGHFGCFQD